MATPQTVSAAQLAAARAAAWRQAGEPLLTLEAARDWLLPLGLVLFAPRAQQLGAPAPSLVEATLGAANEAPTLEQTETARSLAARLIAEGHAVGLNLLGGPGDVPDFLVSIAVLPFVFTLRGDKLWKQSPAGAGATKVTPLALNVYEMLSDRGVMSAAELASELGRELTESAVARALNELWQRLRVVPLPAQDPAEPTRWELISRRFTKAIKAGTNAGVPTALSALVSLYLGQAVLASEEQTAGFLSPLVPRSRVREVLHGLMAARELAEVVIDGKTLLHVAGELPEFAAAEGALTGAETEGGTDAAAAANSPAFSTERDAGRIGKFKPRAPGGDRRSGGQSRERPATGGFRRPAAAGGEERRAARPRSSGGERPFRAPAKGGRPDVRSGPRPAPRPREEHERRPFQRDAGTVAGAPESYARPWDEERRTAGARDGDEAARAGEILDANASAAGEPPQRERKPYAARTDRAGGDRKPYAARGSRPSGERKPYAPRREKPCGERKPYAARGPKPSGGGSGRPAREGGFRSGERTPFRSQAGPNRREFSRSEPRSSAPRTERAAGDRADSGYQRSEGRKPGTREASSSWADGGRPAKRSGGFGGAGGRGGERPRGERPGGERRGGFAERRGEGFAAGRRPDFAARDRGGSSAPASRNGAFPKRDSQSGGARPSRDAGAVPFGARSSGPRGDRQGSGGRTFGGSARAGSKPEGKPASGFGSSGGGRGDRTGARAPGSFGGGRPKPNRPGDKSRAGGGARPAGSGFVRPAGRSTGPGPARNSGPGARRSSGPRSGPGSRPKG